MAADSDKLDKLKKHVVSSANNKSFIHHQWFVRWHLDIVNQLAMEMCDLYPKANRELVAVLVWIHDFGRILAGSPENFYKGDALTLSEGKKVLEKIGYKGSFIKKVLGYVDLMNKKMTEDIASAPIEVQIISSADGASHFVGPFMSIFWKEHPEMSLDELLIGNIKKAQKDWLYKITLPEVKERFKERYDHIMESSGKMPERFLK